MELILLNQFDILQLMEHMFEKPKILFNKKILIEVNTKLIKIKKIILLN